MNTISDVTRARIEAQGFVALDDRTLAAINYWLRLAPAICMVWTAIGTALTSPIGEGRLIGVPVLAGLFAGVMLQRMVAARLNVDAHMPAPAAAGL